MPLRESLLKRGVWTDKKGRMRLDTARPHLTTAKPVVAEPSDDDAAAWIMPPFWLASGDRVVVISRFEASHLVNTIQFLRRAVWGTDAKVAEAFDGIGWSHLVAEARRRRILPPNDRLNGAKTPQDKPQETRRAMRRVLKALSYAYREGGEKGLADASWLLRGGRHHRSGRPFLRLDWFRIRTLRRLDAKAERLGCPSSPFDNHHTPVEGLIRKKDRR